MSKPQIISPYNGLLELVKMFGLDQVLYHLAAVAEFEGYDNTSDALVDLGRAANEESYTIT